MIFKGLAAAAAVAWALGLVVLQPLSEPIGPETYANNTYWARELRWGALLALVLALIVLSGGRRRANWSIVAGGCAWLAADVVLDRFDVDQGAAWFAAGAAVVALAGCAVVAAPRPGSLRAAAIVAAVASGLATATESPTDTEMGLHLGSAAVGSLLALVAVAAAAGRRRVPIAVPVLAAAVPWLLRFNPLPDGMLWFGCFAFTVLLVVAVVALATPHVGQHGIVATIAAITLPVMLLPLTLASVLVQSGKPFTLLAANPPIEVDEDVILIVLAIPVGIVLDHVLRGFSPEPAVPDTRPRASLSRQ
ncbi:hypothetical protein [Actinoplanes solisilvae]|uniref:hypothetical protein n=1 Tax=Actinoplanes solisilvae TaxID=2486853 RepID=UPI000FDCD935|nr:hypothetical protein [Actinoplanes solisilvae]